MENNKAKRGPISEFFKNKNMLIGGYYLSDVVCGKKEFFPDGMPDCPKTYSAVSEHWTQDLKNEYLKLVYKSHGYANTRLGIQMFIMGLPEQTIIKFCKYHYGNKPNDKFFVSVRRPRKRCPHGEKYSPTHFRAPYKETARNEGCYVGNKIKQHFSAHEAESVDQQTVAATENAYYSPTATVASVVTGESRFNSPAEWGALFFVVADEHKRQTILARKETAELVLKMQFNRRVPTELQKVFSPKSFAKRQAEDLYRDLYALAKHNGEIDAPLVNAGNNKHKLLIPLSTAGYAAGKIKNPRAIAQLETAEISLENMGLGIYHKPTPYGPHTYSRGYVRLLQRINSVYREYGKMLRRGTKPSIARDTAVQLLEFWLKDGSNTDREWRVFKRMDWHEPDAVEKPNKNRTSASPRKKTTMAEAMAILNKVKQEQYNDDNQ